MHTPKPRRRRFFLRMIFVVMFMSCVVHGEDEPDPTPEPVPDPTPEPVPDPTPEPVPDPTPEPIPDPTPEPIPDPTPEPVPDTPAPVETDPPVTPSPVTPSPVTPSPVEAVTLPETPSPSAQATVTTPSPVEAVTLPETPSPSAQATVTTPSPSVEAVQLPETPSPSAQATVTTPSPTSDGETPSPTSDGETPSPTSDGETPSPTTEGTPSPTSGSASPTAPGETPSPTSGSASPTAPGETPSPTTSSESPTADGETPSPTITPVPVGSESPTVTPAPDGSESPTGTLSPTATLPPSEAPTEDSPSSQPSTSPSTQPSTSPSTMPSPGPSTEEFIGLVEGAEMTLYGIDELEGDSKSEFESSAAEFTDMFWSGNDGVDLITTAINVTDVISNSRRLRGRSLQDNATQQDDDLSVTVVYSHGFIYETDSPQSIGPRLLASLPFSTSNSRAEFVELLNESEDPVLVNVTDSSAVSLPATPESNVTEAPSIVTGGSIGDGSQPTSPPITGDVGTLLPTQSPWSDTDSGACGYSWSQMKIASFVGGVSAIAVLLL